MITRQPRHALSRSLLVALAWTGIGGCAHQREAFFPPSNRMSRAEPALDPSTPGVAESTRSPRTANTKTRSQPAGRGSTVESSADVFDFDAYRD